MQVPGKNGVQHCVNCSRVSAITATDSVKRAPQWVSAPTGSRVRLVPELPASGALDRDHPVHSGGRHCVPAVADDSRARDITVLDTAGKAVAFADPASPDEWALVPCEGTVVNTMSETAIQSS
ncbi:hypothetical protein HJG60_008683 [Phyllostomus discolor]|uniref:Uncharacterized protein n=1 Tax=Phyllostomus discolor TaxID=89673 RepID=A0A833Z549_9CHIR|nr:hypothetical protein HJG60_008683 [Phyllostomus discolor]